MSTDVELESALRRGFESLAAADPLPELVVLHSLDLGRAAARRRMRRGTAATAIAAVLVVAAVGGAWRAGSPDREPPPTQPSPSPTETAAPPESIIPATWVDSLPFAYGLQVPYLVGTTVVNADGTRVTVPGTSAGIVGLSTYGLVLLVETEAHRPYSFESRYVLVDSLSGEVRDLPLSTLTADGAQEAVISPDGSQMTAGGDIIDLSSFVVTGRVPDAADILYAWTSAGILYGAGGRSYLWPLDGEPIELAHHPGGFASGSDVGLRGCRLVRVRPTGETVPVSECIRGLRSVAPSGHLALTKDLALVDIRDGSSAYLAGFPVRPAPYAFDKVWWEDDQALVLPVEDQLVRCVVALMSCARVTDVEPDLALP